MSRKFQSNDARIAKVGKDFASHVLYRHPLKSAFSDMVHSWVIAIRNELEPKGPAWDAREAEYMKIVETYGREGMDIFADSLGVIALASSDGFGDHIGQLYMQLAANSKHHAQFFTPYTVSSMMARITLTPDMVSKAIEDHGHLLAQEPSCGAGGMVVAMGEAIASLGHDPMQVLRVHAIDIDATCVDMTYMQAHLQRVPCFVERADALDPTSGERFNYRFANIGYALQLSREYQNATYKDAAE